MKNLDPETWTTLQTDEREVALAAALKGTHNRLLPPDYVKDAAEAATRYATGEGPADTAKRIQARWAAELQRRERETAARKAAEQRPKVRPIRGA